MNITDPITVMPVVLNPQIIRRFASNRVRATILPLLHYRELRPDDLLSVFEPVSIEEKQFSRDKLRIRYDGSHVRVGVPWPSMLKKPAPGRRTAYAMPICCSRYTLRVKSAEVVHLFQISDEDAIACGVEPSFGGGFCSPLGDPEWFKPNDTGWQALEHLWQEVKSPAMNSADPKVVLVHFDSIARNISKIVPDFGTGVAPWT